MRTLAYKETNSSCLVNGMAVRIFVNVRQLMHPRMVFEVRSAWLQRGGRLGQGFHRFQGHWSSGHLHSNIASKEKDDRNTLDSPESQKERELRQRMCRINTTGSVTCYLHGYIWQCGQNILSTYQSIYQSYMSINTRRELTMGWWTPAWWSLLSTLSRWTPYHNNTTILYSSTISSPYSHNLLLFIISINTTIFINFIIPIFRIFFSLTNIFLSENKSKSPTSGSDGRSKKGKRVSKRWTFKPWQFENLKTWQLENLTNESSKGDQSNLHSETWQYDGVKRCCGSWSEPPTLINIWSTSLRSGWKGAKFWANL